MTLEASCPKCGRTSVIELFTWDSAAAYPFICSHCDEFYWIRRRQDIHETVEVKDRYWKNKEKIPPLRVGTLIYITNKEHPLFLERGEIIEKSHVHYKILFKSLNDKIKDKCLWVPEHWVAKIPEELIT